MIPLRDREGFAPEIDLLWSDSAGRFGKLDGPIVVGFGPLQARPACLPGPPCSIQKGNLVVDRLDRVLKPEAVAADTRD